MKRTEYFEQKDGFQGLIRHLKMYLLIDNQIFKRAVFDL